MEDLTAKRCKPCEGGVEPMTLQEAEAQMRHLNGEWQLLDAGKALKRSFRFRDFLRTMSFVNAVAHIANIEDHHPDLEVGYDYCDVRYSTHAVRGLSENDFICAAKIDRLAVQ